MDIITTLNTVLNSNNIRYSILDSVIDDMKNNPRIIINQDVEFGIIEKYSIVLKYYLITRDEKIDYTYQEIYEKYKALINTSFIDYPVLKENSIDNGYLTSAFNGSDYDLVSKYGLDYLSKSNDEEKAKITSAFKSLKELEKALGKNDFSSSQELTPEGRTVYLSAPGYSTIQYAMRQSPERLYNGPLKYNYTKMIVGETKEEYIKRSLLSKLDLQKPYEKDVDNVASTYCNSNPCIAFISMDKIKHIPISKAKYDKNKVVSLEELISEFPINYVDDFFSKGKLTSPGKGNIWNQDRFCDMVSIAPSIPKDAIRIISVPDLFDLKQDLAIMLGFNIGSSIDPNFQEETLMKGRVI